MMPRFDGIRTEVNELGEISRWRASRRRRDARAERRDDREHARIWERIVRGDFDSEA